MSSKRTPYTLLSTLAFAGLFPAARAHADTTLQLWTNMMLEWQSTPRLLYTFDAEPKVLAEGDGQWLNLDVTQSVEFAPVRYIDLLAEFVTGYTEDDESPDAWEVTERLGLRVYPIRARLQLRDTFRFEQRNRFFDDDTSDHLFRSRNRVEARYVLNRERPSEAGAVIAMADFEWFIPHERNVRERYASRYRVRAGFGYRLSTAWRADLIYFFQASRNTYGESFENHDHIIDLRLRRAF